MKRFIEAGTKKPAWWVFAIIGVFLIALSAIARGRFDFEIPSPPGQHWLAPGALFWTGIIALTYPVLYPILVVIRTGKEPEKEEKAEETPTETPVKPEESKP